MGWSQDDKQNKKERLIGMILMKMRDRGHSGVIAEDIECMLEWLQRKKDPTFSLNSLAKLSAQEIVAYYGNYVGDLNSLYRPT